MKTRRLVFMSCLAAAALIASPALGEVHKKSMATSASKPQRMAPRTTQMTPHFRQARASANAATRQQVTTPRYTGTRHYVGNRYYGGSRYYAAPYYGGTRYYYSGGWGGWNYPYYGFSFGPSGYYGAYPYSYYTGYPYSSSYYTPGYSDDTSTVAAVQRRLGELGYYHGIVDGIMGPRTRAAISAYESTHGLFVDGMITPRLLDRIGLA
jgi:hypothetical protein